MTAGIIMADMSTSKDEEQCVTIVAANGKSQKLPISHLSEKSDYFHALVNSGMQEIQKGSVKLPVISETGLKVSRLTF